MQIKGNITQKDNNKLVYVNLVLVAICAYLLYAFWTERNYKEIVAIDSAQEIYHGRMIRVPDREATSAYLKAHVRLAFMYLYNLSEYNYPDHIERALHLWSYEGANVVSRYERESLFDLLSNTPTRIECIVKKVEIVGEKVTENLQYPKIITDTLSRDINFINQVKENVRTFLVRTETYHRIIRGGQILNEEIHKEELEVYTGFDIDAEYNPFGYKCETISREVTRIK